MDFQRRAKGILTQGLVQALFEDAGYRVRGLGVEEILSEMKDASPMLYHSLPKGLRSLPDFLILDDRREQSWLLEVKYRKTWSSRVVDALEATLTEQAKHWNEFLFLVFLGDSATPDDRCRIFKLTNYYGKLQLESALSPKTFLYWSQAEWKYAFPVQQVFPRITADKIVQQCCLFAHALSIILDSE